jgi:hypothetical protein
VKIVKRRGRSCFVERIVLDRLTHHHQVLMKSRFMGAHDRLFVAYRAHRRENHDNHHHDHQFHDRESAVRAVRAFDFRVEMLESCHRFAQSG